MGLRGTAFLALWNDVDMACDEEYDRWHSEEHVPERVRVAGFLSGHRYAARERTARRYFTLYELERIEALDSAQYRQLVDSPSAWSARMRPAFRNFVRSPCMLLGSLGTCGARSIATVCFAAPADSLPSELLDLLQVQGVTGVHMGRVERSGHYPIAGALASSHTHVLLLEGVERGLLEEAAAAVTHRLRAAGARHVSGESYALAGGNLGGRPLPNPPGTPHGEKTDATDC